MKNTMPAFLKKKKRDPKSVAPGKNTKERSVGKGKPDSEVRSDNHRPSDKFPAEAPANKADYWLAQQAKPKNRGRNP